MSAEQDTEITLGTGKILGLFFGLVVFSAVVFGLGYTLGRNSARSSVAVEPPASTTTTVGGTRATPTKTNGAASDGTAKPAEPLTFYKAVEQTEANSQLSPPPAATKAPPDVPPVKDAEANKDAAPPDPTALPGSTSYFVQVAAVSKHEDADALVDALKKKQYPAFVTNGTAADKLFRVQLGPYGDIKDAEIMRAKLVSDGYNPILKR